VELSPFSERSGHLLIHESARLIHLGDPGSHLERESEMPSPPGDLLTEFDMAFGYAVHGRSPDSDIEAE
jgi:hypothetical protein